MKTKVKNTTSRKHDAKLPVIKSRHRWTKLTNTEFVCLRCGHHKMLNPKRYFNNSTYVANPTKCLQP